MWTNVGNILSIANKMLTKIWQIADNSWKMLTNVDKIFQWIDVACFPYFIIFNQFKSNQFTTRTCKQFELWTNSAPVCESVSFWHHLFWFITSKWPRFDLDLTLDSSIIQDSRKSPSSSTSINDTDKIAC